MSKSKNKNKAKNNQLKPPTVPVKSKKGGQVAIALGVTVILIIILYIAFAGSGNAVTATTANAAPTVNTPSNTVAVPPATQNPASQNSVPAEPAKQSNNKKTGGLQKVSVAVNGSYNPNPVELKAGAPAEVTFGQSSGCTSYVVSTDLGFQEDLSSSPKTIKLPALKPGVYGFACGMNMVTGSIVVK